MSLENAPCGSRFLSTAWNIEEARRKLGFWCSRDCNYFRKRLQIREKNSLCVRTSMVVFLRESPQGIHHHIVIKFWQVYTSNYYQLDMVHTIPMDCIDSLQVYELCIPNWSVLYTYTHKHTHIIEIIYLCSSWCTYCISSMQYTNHYIYQLEFCWTLCGEPFSNMEVRECGSSNHCRRWHNMLHHTWTECW